jgi:tetrathionate reductase subunit B
VACKRENNVPLGVWRSWVKQVEKGSYPYVRKAFLPLLCNNCESPICVTVCPVKASYQREDGLTLVDPHRCIGCRYCMAACPYDVRYINPLLPIVQKCDWCVHRLDQGLRPACVEACPTNARYIGNVRDPQSEIYRLIHSNPVMVMKPEMNTSPMVYYINADQLAMDARGGARWKKVHE